MSLKASLVETWARKLDKLPRSQIQEITFQWPAGIPLGLCELRVPVTFNLRLYDLRLRIYRNLVRKMELVCRST